MITDFSAFTAAEYIVIFKSILNLYTMDSKLNTSKRMNHENPPPNHAMFRTLITSVGAIFLYLHDWFMERDDNTRLAHPEETLMNQLDAVRGRAEAEATAAGVLSDIKTHTRFMRARLHLKRKMPVPPPEPLLLSPLPTPWRLNGACQFGLLGCPAA
jgi:hypothetical protein